MKGWITTLLAHVAQWLARNYRKTSLEWVRIQAALCYIRGVAGARKAFLAAVLLAGCLILGGVGFVLLHVGLYALLPPPANAVTLLALGAAYLVAALLSLRWACSEKTWMKYSKAARFAALAARRDRG